MVLTDLPATAARRTTDAQAMSHAMNLLMDVYGDYMTAINLTLELLPWENIDRMLQVLQQARMQQRTIFVLGSGASAAAAAHMAAALEREAALPGGSPHFRVTPIINATPRLPIWDDDGERYGIALRLKGRLRPEDVTIAIAAHNAPPEILTALQYARACGGYTIGLLDEAQNSLAPLVHLAVTVPNGAVDQIEDVCQILVHIVVRSLGKLRESPVIPAKAVTPRRG